jgi:hypothetical protein
MAIQTPPSTLRRQLLLSGLAASTWTFADLARANTTTSIAKYPDHPVRFIVPFTAGSIGDLFVRPILSDMSDALGQPFVVDNKPGASQAIGADATTKAAPDGYTLCLATQSGLILNQLAKKKLPFDPMNDLTPIGLLFTSPMFLYVSPNLRVKTPMELVALAKSKPGQLNFGSIGPGTSAHLCGELFKSMAGIDITHIPYKAGPEATTALISGQVDLMFNGGNTFNYMRSGKVMALASSGLKRSASLPQLPTMHESGFAGFEVLPWFGMFGPAGLPKELVNRLNNEVNTRLRNPQSQEKYLNQGIEVTPSTPEQLAALMKSDLISQAALMKKAGITPE